MGGLVSAKFLFVMIVAMIVLGPEKLPEVARTAGRLMAEFRRVTGGLQNEVREAFDTSDLAKPVQEFRAATESFRSAATGWVGPMVGLTGTPASAGSGGGGSTGRPRSSVGPVQAQAPGPARSPRLWSGDLGPAPGDPSLN